MPDKAHDGRNVALKFLSDCWHARSSKEEFLQLQALFSCQHTLDSTPVTRWLSVVTTSTVWDVPTCDWSCSLARPSGAEPPTSEWVYSARHLRCTQNDSQPPSQRQRVIRVHVSANQLANVGFAQACPSVLCLPKLCCPLREMEEATRIAMHGFWYRLAIVQTSICALLLTCTHTHTHLSPTPLIHSLTCSHPSLTHTSLTCPHTPHTPQSLTPLTHSSPLTPVLLSVDHGPSR